MPLKKFNEYLVNKSTDPKTFEKKVAFASTDLKCDLFQVLTEESQFSGEFTSVPIVVWGDFKVTPKLINENRLSLYNIVELPSVDSIYEKLDGEPFIPKSTSNRLEVAKLKFPIVGVNGSQTAKFSTYNKFKKAEGKYSKFREDPMTSSKFNVIVFKKKPIHIQENINSIGFDVNLDTFKGVDTIKRVVESISKYHSLDLYRLDIIKSDGGFYLKDLNRSGALSPSQKVKIYEAVYENHYSARLPVWFKNRLFENNIKGFYRKSYYDSLLLNPKYSIDFKKFA